MSIIILADNPSKLAYWYSDVFGISFLAMSNKFGAYFNNSTEIKSNICLMITQANKKPFPIKPMSGIRYAVKDLESLLRYLQSKGVKVDGAKKDTKDHLAWLHDPEGNVIELYEEREYESGKPDTQYLMDLALVKGWEAYKTTKDKSTWRNAVIEELGEEVYPYLDSVWEHLAKDSLRTRPEDIKQKDHSPRTFIIPKSALKLKPLGNGNWQYIIDAPIELLDKSKKINSPSPCVASHSMFPVASKTDKSKESFMNKKQLILFFIVVGLIVLTGLIPPWKLGPYRGVEIAGPYSPIWKPPQGIYQIDATRLAIQWVLIGVLASAAWVLLKKKE